MSSGLGDFCRMTFPSCLGYQQDLSDDLSVPGGMAREPVILNVYDMVSGAARHSGRSGDTSELGLI